MTDGGLIAGLGVVLLAIVSLARFLLGDNKVAATHTQQIAALTTTVARLEAKVAVMDEQITVQRSLKHDMRQDLMKALFPLGMVAEADSFEKVEMLQPTIRSVLTELHAKEEARRAVERESLGIKEDQ